MLVDLLDVSLAYDQLLFLCQQRLQPHVVVRVVPLQFGDLIVEVGGIGLDDFHAVCQRIDQRFRELDDGLGVIVLDLESQGQIFIRQSYDFVREGAHLCSTFESQDLFCSAGRT